MRLLCADTSNETQAEFLARRKGRIGSSDIKSIVGLCPYRTPLSVWCEMTGKVDGSFEDNRNMRLGRRREADVANEYAIETGLETTKANQAWQHDSYDWAMATPDYLAKDHGLKRIIECKTTKGMNFWKYETRAPDDAHIQTIWQQGIGGIGLGAVACLSGDNQFVYHHFDFDQEVFDITFSVAERFVEDVRRDIPPRATSSDMKLLSKLYPAVVEAKQTDLSDIQDEIARYQDISAQRKQFAKAEDDLKAFIRQKMGDASFGVIGDRRVVTISNFEKESYTVAASSQSRITIK